MKPNIAEMAVNPQTGEVIGGDIEALRRFMRVPANLDASLLTMVAAVGVTRLILDDVLCNAIVRAEAHRLMKEHSWEEGKAMATTLKGVFAFLSEVMPETLDDEDESQPTVTKGYL